MLQVIQSINLTILDKTHYPMLHKMPITLSIIFLSKYAVNKKFEY